MEFTGKVIEILNKQNGVAKSSGKSWTKQEYVVEEVQESYPQKLCFEVFGEDKIELFNIKKGEIVTAHINVSAKQWNGRWFNSIQAWKVDKDDNNSQVPTQQSSPKKSIIDEMPF